MKATIEQISTITPAAIAKIPIHFQIPPSSPSSGVMSLASCFSAPVVDLSADRGAALVGERPLAHRHLLVRAASEQDVGGTLRDQKDAAVLGRVGQLT